MNAMKGHGKGNEKAVALKIRSMRNMELVMVCN